MAEHAIDGLAADLQVAEAARLALAVRLHAVRDQVQSTDGGADAVHDLRVAVRRAATTIDTFRICIKRKASKQAKERLRTLRRAAGAVRDWDVFLALLRSGAAPKNDLLHGYCLGRREAASADLVKTLDGARSDVVKLCDRLPRRVRRPAAEAIRKFKDLLPAFESRLEDFDKALKKSSRKPEALHRLRVEAKKLRYAMELFAPCCGPRMMDSLYPQVEALQTHLGEAHDAAAALAVLEHIGKTITASDTAAFLEAERMAAEERFETHREAWTGP
jgi:CHAD domain-containing protein